MFQLKNPIIPGFYPDPSICRDGEDYYLVNSSFEFFPGIPLFHSRDLIHWAQIGHVLTRRSQLELTNCKASEGIWAPTIRKHKDRFYVSVTNYGHGGNCIVWTDDIRGQWSDPIWIDQGGIDPSLFFDDDGKVYFTSTYDMPETQGIGQCIIDIETGEKRSDTVLIWNGTGGKYTEAPHMLKKDKYYYLIAAEGGTEYGHMITIARADNPWGPFENCRDNPILTHRDTKLHQFQAVGHGDFVEDVFGKWWIVFHGIRTSQYMLHHLGRETMISPVEWSEEGWPIVNGGKTVLPEQTIERQLAPMDNVVDFQNILKVNYLRNPQLEHYDLEHYPEEFSIRGTNVTLNELASPSFIGIRQQQFDTTAYVTVQCDKVGESEKAGLTVFHTNEHHYDLYITSKAGKRMVCLRKVVGDIQVIQGITEMPSHKDIHLRICSDRLKYEFFAGASLDKSFKIGEGRTQLLSTECMPMTFTGCYIGTFAEGDVKAVFRDFHLV